MRPLLQGRGVAIRTENVIGPQTFDHRTAAREEIVLPVVIGVGTTRHNAVMRNLSAAGAMIMTSAPLDPNMKVELQCGTICTGGTVIWQRESDFGIRFDKPVSERQVDEQMSRSNAVVSWHKGRPSSGISN